MDKVKNNFNLFKSFKGRSNKNMFFCQTIILMPFVVNSKYWG